MIKAKYRMMGNIHFKFFKTAEEKDEFFKKYKMCQYISEQAGAEVEQEYYSLGYK